MICYVLDEAVCSVDDSILYTKILLELKATFPHHMKIIRDDLFNSEKYLAMMWPGRSSTLMMTPKLGGNGKKC